MLALAVIATIFVLLSFLNSVHMVNTHNRFGINPLDLMFALIEFGFVITTIWILYSRIP